MEDAMMSVMTQDKFESLNELTSMEAILNLMVSEKLTLTAKQARAFLAKAVAETENLMKNPYGSWALLSSAHWFNVINYNLDHSDPEFNAVWDEVADTRFKMYSKIEKYIQKN